MNKPLNTSFSENWNGKLAGKAFTTIRLYNEKKYCINSVHEIYLKKVPLGKAKVIGMRKMKHSSINEWIARLDTGYSLPELLRILDKMYGAKGKVNHERIYSLVLFEWQERYQEPLVSFDVLKMSINGRMVAVPVAAANLIIDLEGQAKNQAV